MLDAVAITAGLWLSPTLKRLLDIVPLCTSYSIIRCPDKTRSYPNKQIQKSQHRDTRRMEKQSTQPSKISEKKKIKLWDTIDAEIVQPR